MTDPKLALALAVIIAAVYIGVLRLIDVNEKEPVWAMGLVLFVGVLAGLLLPLIVSTPQLEFEPVIGAIAQEAAKFAALAVGLGLLGVIANVRGFSEVNGLGDGIVYGAAAGLGYAVGDTFFRDLSASEQARELLSAGPFTILWTTALYGLAQGVFSAITGAGFGAAVSRSDAARVTLPLVGLVGAVIVHLGYVELRGDPLTGSTSALRGWLGLLIPVALVAAAVVIALVRERRAIAEELSGETEGGVVNAEEMRLLRSPGARRGEYARRFFSGDFDGWLAMRGLQNRQVQLALAKRRASRGGDQQEVERLRAAVTQARQELEAASAPPAQAKAGG